MTWPALLFWVVTVAAALSSGPALLTLFMVAGAFGTLQMLPGGGGGNILPQAVCAAALTIKVLIQPGNATRGLAIALDPRRLGLLTAFAAYGAVTAVLLPRLFAGRLELFSVSGSLSGTSLVAPSGGNVTQSGYIILSSATALAFAVIGSRPDARRHILTAILAGGFAVIVTGLLDLAAYAAGAGTLLDPFRTVTYSLLTDVETLGSKRVTGLMSEASSYGSLCVVMLGLLALLRPCFPQALRRGLVPIAILSLLAMAGLSTSSSAYAGLLVFAATFALNWLIRLVSPDAPGREDLRGEAVVVVLVGFALLCLFVLAPQTLAPSSAIIDSAVLEKSTSASFIERGNWTAFGWRAFIDTGGLGVGIGSLRVSNWFVSILGSTGVFGAVLMFGFILWSLVPSAGARPSAQDREWERGLRLSLLPCLAMAALIGTMPDIGVLLAAVFGLLAAARPAPARGRLPRLHAPVLG